MNNKSIMYSFLAFSLVVAIVCSVFMAVSISTASVGVNDGAFRVDQTLAFKTVSWMFVGCLVAFLVFTFVFKKCFSKKIKFKSSSFYFTSVLGALISAGLAIYGFVAQLNAHNSLDKSNLLLQSPTPISGIYFPNVLFIIALLGTAAYFLLGAFGKMEKRSNTFAAISLLLPATLAIKLICDFLVQNTNGYSKLYNFHLVALAFFMLFAVNESRVYLRKAAPALYVFFGVAGSMAGMLYAIPSLVLNANGVAPLRGTTAIIYCVVDLLMVVFVYVRLFSLGVKETNNAAIEYDPAVIFNEDGDK